MESRRGCFWPEIRQRYPGVTFRGQTLPMNQWAKILGVSKEQIRRELLRGKTMEEAFAFRIDDIDSNGSTDLTQVLTGE